MNVVGICKKDGMNSASARIRYFTFLENIPEIKWHNYNGKADGDIAYIQKISDEDSISLAKKAHKAGIPIIYDIDDIRKDWNSKGCDDIIKYATAITTDTKLKADHIIAHTKKPVHVIPDCIDYGIKRKIIEEVKQYVRSMVTFGNKVTIENTVKDFSKLKVDKYHICNEKIKGAGKFIEWNHKIFIDILKDFDCAILSNRKHWTADLKSNNRLLVCMAIGLPVMALNMPAYSEILMREEFYEGELLFDSTPEDTFKFLSNYSVRNHLNQVMPEYAFENYGPDKSAKKLYEVFKEYGN